MGAFLADEPLPILEGIALVAVSLGLIVASVARARARRSINVIARMFWDDVGRAAYIWAAATVLVLVGALGNVEGLEVPVWLVLSIVVGAVCLLIVQRRWARLGLPADRTGSHDPSRPDRPHLVSTSWEIAILYAGGGGLLVYGVSVAHLWGHPIHWLVAGIGAAVGYAVGLIMATPRFTVRRRSI